MSFIPRRGYPRIHLEHREYDIVNDICPECGGELDTGWQCNDCKFDVRNQSFTMSDSEEKSIIESFDNAIIAIEKLKNEMELNKLKVKIVIFFIVTFMPIIIGVFLFSIGMFYK